MSSKTTHIGSLPFTKIEDAINFNKDFDLPVISTLPNIDPNEFMIEQIALGIANSKIEDFKIIINELDFIKDFEINFLILDKFIKEFKNKDIKWQLIGPITLIRSFKDPLSEFQIKKILNWYQSLINNFYNKHKEKFSNMIFILDEPLFDTKFKGELLYILKKIKKTNGEIGIHCCSKLEINELKELKLDYLSIDCSLYSLDELLILKNVTTKLISGVVDTQLGDITFSDSKILNQSKYLSPTCGLALSEIHVCHKALNNLSHL